MIATGLPPSPGAIVGQVVFSTVDAEIWHVQGKTIILVSFLIERNYKIANYYLKERKKKAE